MNMNKVGALVGWVLGILVAVSTVVTIDALAWGSHAPTWFIFPCITIGVVSGFVGATLGERYL